MTSVLTRDHGGIWIEPDEVEIIDDPPAPRSRRSRLAIALVVVLFAELLARVVGPLGPTPLEWRDAIVQLKVEQMEARPSAEVVLAGTSMMMQGVDPSGLSVDAYNSAIDAAAPATQRDWLVDQVVPRLEPTTIIWGLAPMDLNDSRDHPWVQSYYEAPATKPGFFGSAERVGRDLSALVRYRTELREPGEFIEGLGSAEDWRPAGITSDGFRNRFDQTPTTQHRLDTAAFFTDYGASTADADIVEAVVTELHAQGITVVLAALPIPDRTVELLPNGSADLDTFDAQLAAISSRTGAPVVDLRAGLTDDRFYTDYAHLTEEGAARLTANLDEFLTSDL